MMLRLIKISEDSEDDCACQCKPREHFFRCTVLITGSDDISMRTVKSVNDKYGEQAEEVGIGSPGFPQAQMCQSVYHACHTASRTLISCKLIKPAGDPQTGEGNSKEVGEACKQNFQP